MSQSATTVSTTRTAPEADAFYRRIYGRLYALGYHRRRDYSHAKALCQRLLSAHRDRFETALDVGCSTGWAVRRLAGEGVGASGIDVAPQPVSQGRAAGLDLHRGSAAALPFEADSFDLVMSTDCFEHLRPEDVEAAVDEACRVARTTLAFKINPRVDRNGWWKLLAGTRLHLTTRSLSWWIEAFERRGCRLLDLDDSDESFVLAAPGT